MNLHFIFFNFVFPLNMSKTSKMKSVKLKKFLPATIFLFALVSMTSCNRGVGCPSDFSITKTVIKTVQAAPIVAKEILK